MSDDEERIDRIANNYKTAWELSPKERIVRALHDYREQTTNADKALVALVKAALYLQELKEIKVRMENGSANSHETLRYNQEKEMAWERLREALAALPEEWKP